MSRLSEKTIDELNDKVNFTKASTAVDSLYEARSHLNDEVINDLKRLAKSYMPLQKGLWTKRTMNCLIWPMNLKVIS